MKDIDVIDLGLIEYGKALEVQREHFTTLSNNLGSKNFLLFCEHYHVYTLGKSGNSANLLISDAELKRIDATFYKTDRGGDITYHGLGQLVGYPIINIQNFNIGLRSYIERLEQSIMDTIGEYGIKAYRVEGATGVWVNTEMGEKKIAAIGVKISRYITMHGFALNVNTDLNYFSYINPCGFAEKGVTSLQELLGREVCLEEVKEKFSCNFLRVIRG